MGNALFDRWYLRGRNADLVESKPQQQWKMTQVCGHVSTHAHPAFMFVYGHDNALQKIEEARMLHIREPRHSDVAAIGGKKILAEIVRADTEEVDLGAELVQNKGTRGNFNHDSNRHRWIEGDVLSRQVMLYLLDLLFHP